MRINLEWDLLNEVDYVQSKISGARYSVKQFNPAKHELIEPNITKERYQELEREKQQQRGAEGVKQLKQDPQAVSTVKKTEVPKEIGPETPQQAIGDNPKVEKKLATRMAQLGKHAANYINNIKQLTKELKSQNPELADDELGKLVKKTAKEKGLVKPPEFDLCSISVPGTNLYCGGNKEIPRDAMPQLKTKAVEGTKAWSLAQELAKEKGGDPKDMEVNAEPHFLEFLKDKGYDVTMGETMPATDIKATQNQLNADKVAGMAWALLTNPDTQKPEHPLRQPLIVSADGYVLDGHHRWAALATYDMMNGKEDVVDVPVVKVDMDIEDLVDMSNQFGDEFGLQRKGVGASAEGTGKAGEKKPEAPVDAQKAPAKESWNRAFQQFIHEEMAVKFVKLPPTKLPTGGWKEEWGYYVYSGKKWTVVPASDVSLRSKKYFDVIGPNGKRVKNLDSWYHEQPFGGERDSIAHMIAQSKGNWPTKDIDAKDWV